MDEPTNHLDTKAKKALADAISSFSGSVVFVGHENEFAKMVENCFELNLKEAN